MHDQEAAVHHRRLRRRERRTFRRRRLLPEDLPGLRIERRQDPADTEREQAAVRVGRRRLRPHAVARRRLDDGIGSRVPGLPDLFARVGVERGDHFVVAGLPAERVDGVADDHRRAVALSHFLPPFHRQGLWPLCRRAKRRGSAIAVDASPLRPVGGAALRTERGRVAENQHCNQGQSQRHAPKYRAGRASPAVTH